VLSLIEKRRKRLHLTMEDSSASTTSRQGTCRCNLGEENRILQARILELEEKLTQKDAELLRQNELVGAMTGQLEEQIHERTKALEQANTHLELANTSITQQAANMLKNFACMSHEIRTRKCFLATLCCAPSMRDVASFVHTHAVPFLDYP
jgi:multidrug resistance efflux pump